MLMNVGKADVIIRVLLGIGLLTLFFILPDQRRWFGLVGLIPLFTAAIKWCPLYALLGLRTCPLHR